ncbi:MAG: isoprenylcysteine carboxylmethyltransferase family protein [Clostridia bacterium]|nr:isoprenylcysteine carboxylmethyltransferase family protein [Clostridia bacterium]
MRRLLPPTLLFMCLGMMCLLHFALPFTDVIPFPLNLSGIIVLILGGAVTVAGSNKFRRVGTTEMTFDEPGLLVQDGIYNITRNPMYLGFVLFLLGIWVIMGSLSPLVVVVCFAVITDRWYIRFEEEMLMKKFGEKYLSYKTKVRRWI